MPFEWLVGTRYLAATRSKGAPSVITVISVLAVAVGVAALIFVLAILGGFEGDLRTKILGTKAHLLVTGASSSPLVDPDPLLDVIAGVDGVVGVSPFIESDVMIASATNYSGIVLRGIEPARIRTTTDMDRYVVDGELEWLLDPSAAVRRPAEGSGDAAVLGTIEELERQAAELRARLDALRDGAAVDEDDPSGASGSAPPEVRGEADARVERIAQAQLETPPGGPDGQPAEDEGSGARVGPPSLQERLDARRAGPPSLEDRLRGPGAGAGPPDRRPASRRDLPGILIGTELRDSLHVDVGDQVQIINPDGDDGPTGPIPRAWPYRVVGVFYTGLYEYDNSMVYMALPQAREFLRTPEGRVTGVEVRIRDMDAARTVGAQVEAALAAVGREDVKVATWMELNDRLFSALMLEQLVIGLLLMIIVLVASFAIVCVLIMVVIQRGDEIAIMRSMGASARAIQRIFVVQGMSIGLGGTAIGLVVGLGLVAYLLFVGFPLDANVYYIDRVPVELNWSEVCAVVGGAVAISAVATILPSMQAARLDPAAALRHE